MIVHPTTKDVVLAMRALERSVLLGDLLPVRRQDRPGGRAVGQFQLGSWPRSAGRTGSSTGVVMPRLRAAERWLPLRYIAVDDLQLMRCQVDAVHLQCHFRLELHVGVSVPSWIKVTDGTLGTFLSGSTIRFARMKARTLVLGIGSPIVTDDAIGFRIVDKLRSNGPG